MAAPSAWSRAGTADAAVNRRRWSNRRIHQTRALGRVQRADESRASRFAPGDDAVDEMPAVRQESRAAHGRFRLRWSTVAGVGTPPDAETLCSAVPPAGEKTMTPSRLQEPLIPGAASHNVTGGPPATSIFFSLPPAKNPSERLSGDQNGDAPPSVPASPLRRERVERPHPDQRAARRISSHERHLPAVWRDGERARPPDRPASAWPGVHPSGGNTKKRVASTAAGARRKYAIAPRRQCRDQHDAERRDERPGEPVAALRGRRRRQGGRQCRRRVRVRRERLEGEREIARRLEARRRVLFETAIDDARQRRAECSGPRSAGRADPP